MIDAALALLGQPLPRGKRVGVVSMGGGLGVVAADALRRQGFELPLPSPATMEKLNAKMSSRWSHGNPVDPAGDLVSYQVIRVEPRGPDDPDLAPPFRPILFDTFQLPGKPPGSFFYLFLFPGAPVLMRRCSPGAAGIMSPPAPARFI